MQLTVDNLNIQAYNVIKMGILERKLPAGTRLVDSRLAEEYGISRTPIRDALMRLTEEGLVEKAGKGYFVFMPSASDIREIFELRLMMDLYCSNYIVNKLLPENPQLREKIEKLYFGQQSLAENTFVAEDERFHGGLVALLGNNRLSNFYAGVCNQMRAFRSITAKNTDRVKQANECHEKIYQAIVNGDAVAAEEAIRKHTRLSMEDALRDFE